jgi:hypothetical protein
VDGAGGPRILTDQASVHSRIGLRGTGQNLAGRGPGQRMFVKLALDLHHRLEQFTIIKVPG